MFKLIGHVQGIINNLGKIQLKAKIYIVNYYKIPFIYDFIKET